MRQGPLTVSAHWPFRFPLSGCSPTLLSGLMWLNRSVAFKIASNSSAASASRPRNRDFPVSNSRRVAELLHDRITIGKLLRFAWHVKRSARRPCHMSAVCSGRPCAPLAGAAARPQQGVLCFSLGGSRLHERGCARDSGETAKKHNHVTTRRQQLVRIGVKRVVAGTCQHCQPPCEQ
jgi:hypothetical protein